MNKKIEDALWAFFIGVDVIMLGLIAFKFIGIV